MPVPEAKDEAQFDKYTSRLRDVFALLKQVFLALAALYLLLFVISPSIGRDRLKSLMYTLSEVGFTSIDIAGVLKSDLKELTATSEQGTKAALHHLKEAHEKLAKLRPSKMMALTGERDRESVITAEAFDDVLRSISAAEDTLKGSSREIAETLQKIKEKESPGEVVAGKWLVVVGADSTERSAKDELKKLKGKVPNAMIVRRSGLYRTVAQFDDRLSAEKKIGEINSLMGRIVFAVDAARWCPELSGKVEAGDNLKTIDCSPPG
jgi:hypothetical protein